MECGGTYAIGVNVTDPPENKKGKAEWWQSTVPADFWADHDHCSAFAVADTVSYRDFPDGGSVRESAHDQ